MYFTLREAEGTEIPVVVEVPHASIQVDIPSVATLVAPVRALGNDADLYVDQLYQDATGLGATLLVATVSRYVCDLNRAEDDVDPRAAVSGRARSAPHGMVWRLSTDNHAALARPLPASELERRIREIHRPYHEALSQALARKKERFGYAILLSGHSMPSRGRGLGDSGGERADVVPGSRGGTTAAEKLVLLPERLARAQGWSVAHDTPYRGGYSTATYGRPEGGYHALQIEIARRLYMDEESLGKKEEAFEKVRRFCQALVAEAGRLTLP